MFIATVGDWPCCFFFPGLTAILLGHLKMSHAEIKRAVLRLDTETLSEQHLRVMKDFAPDEKEVGSVFL